MMAAVSAAVRKNSPSMKGLVLEGADRPLFYFRNPSARSQTDLCHGSDNFGGRQCLGSPTEILHTRSVLATALIQAY